MAKNKLPKPEKGDPPNKITTPGKPGGPHTPGAKADKEKTKQRFISAARKIASTAARKSEPSSRSLSDKDVQNSIVSLASKAGEENQKGTRRTTGK